MGKIKDFIYKIASWLIKQGADKWLHLLVGMLVAMLSMASLPFLIHDMAAVKFLAVFLPCALDGIKECLIDSKPDFWDFLYTLIGALIGMLFCWMYLNLSSLW